MKRNDIINKMYFASGGLCEKVPLTEEYYKIQNTVCDLGEELSNKLAEYPELSELFSKYEDSKTHLACEGCDIYYVEGFRMGLLLGIDVADAEEPEE